MSERAKLQFDDLAVRPKRPRPNLDELRNVSEEHGFLSRDPAEPAGAGEGGDLASPPMDTPAPVAAPLPETPSPQQVEAAAVPQAPVPSMPASADPMVFRRRGRPPSDRLYPLNIKVSQNVLQRVYDIRDEEARRTLADVIEILLDSYEQRGGAAGD